MFFADRSAANSAVSAVFSLNKAGSSHNRSRKRALRLIQQYGPTPVSIDLIEVLTHQITFETVGFQLKRSYARDPRPHWRRACTFCHQTCCDSNNR